MRISDWNSDVCSSDLLTRSDPQRADAMLGHLIAYLRRSLPRNLDGQSTLGEELERAVAYLAILTIRMGSRLSTQVDVPEPLYPAAFPAMIPAPVADAGIHPGLESKPGAVTIGTTPTH